MASSYMTPPLRVTKIGYFSSNESQYWYSGFEQLSHTILWAYAFYASFFKYLWTIENYTFIKLRIIILVILVVWATLILCHIWRHLVSSRVKQGTPLVSLANPKSIFLQFVFHFSFIHSIIYRSKKNKK